MGTLLVLVGTVIAAIGSIWFLIAVFKNSIIAGILCLLTGIASFVCLFLYWKDVKVPFLLQLLGGALIFVARVLLHAQWQFQ